MIVDGVRLWLQYIKMTSKVVASTEALRVRRQEKTGDIERVRVQRQGCCSARSRTLGYLN